MDIKHLNESFFVSKQIKLTDLKQLAESGIKTVINNRPDGESQDQVCSDILAVQLQKLGLEYHFLPVSRGQISQKNFSKFGAIVKNETGPILAFCRTGTRSTLLWAKSKEDIMPAEVIYDTAFKAGYDLTNASLVIAKE